MAFTSDPTLEWRQTKKVAFTRAWILYVTSATVVGISAGKFDILVVPFPVICTYDFSSDAVLYIVTLEKCHKITFSLNMYFVITQILERHVEGRNGAASCEFIVINKGPG